MECARSVIIVEKIPKEMCRDRSDPCNPMIAVAITPSSPRATAVRSA
jgi:hypothetical protein